MSKTKTTTKGNQKSGNATKKGTPPKKSTPPKKEAEFWPGAQFQPIDGVPMIYAAIANINADVEAISKDQQNRQQGFKFRGIDDVYNMLHPIMSKYGVFSVPRVVDTIREDRVTSKNKTMQWIMHTIEYDVYCVDGSSVKAVLKGEGQDSLDKASNKATAGAHKYMLFQVFTIPTEELMDEGDADSDGHDKGTYTQKAPPTNNAAPTPQRQAQQDTTRTNGQQPKPASEAQLKKVDEIMNAKFLEEMIYTDAEITEVLGKFQKYSFEKAEAVLKQLEKKHQERLSGVMSSADDELPF